MELRSHRAAQICMGEGTDRESPDLYFDLILGVHQWMRVPFASLTWAVTGFVAGYAAFYPGWKKTAPLGDGSAGSFKQIALQISEDSLLNRTSAKERVGWLLEICRQPAGLARDNALYEAIQAMQPADFFAALADLPALAAELEKMDASTRENLTQAAIEHWLDVDEPGALRALNALNQILSAGVMKLPDMDARDAGAVYAPLARRAPQWLFDLLPSLGKKAQRPSAIQALLGQSVQSNPGQARKWLESFRGSEDWNPALTAYVQGLAKTDLGSALDLAKAELKEKSEMRRAMLGAYLTGISHAPFTSSALLERFDPEERGWLAWNAVRTVDEQAGSDPLAWIQEQAAAYPEVLAYKMAVRSNTLELLVKRDPMRTIGWLETIPASQGAPFISMAIGAWSKLDPPAALAWLASQSAESLPADLSGIGACAISDPQRFQAWRETLPAGEMRDQAGFAMAQEFAGQGRFAEAQRYFPRDGGTDWFLTSTRELARTFANSDMSAARAWVSQLPSGPVQAMAAKGVLDQSAPTEAAQWAQTLAPGEARDSSMRALAARFAMDDPEAGSQWLEQISDPAIWARGVGDVFQAWSRQEPGRARDWLNQLPGIDDQLKARLLRRRR